MSAATVLTSAMSGMPALSGTAGSLAALIRHIAPVLGWSIEFDNSTDIIVIKPQSYGGGQALYYRFDDRAARGGAAPRVAEVRAYETMTDINTGAGLVGPVYLHKSYTADSVSRTYDIVGDQYGFYLRSVLYNSLNSVDVCSLSYMGFNCPLPGDTSICVLFAETNDAVCSGGSAGFLLHSSPATASVTGAYIHKNRSGVINKAVAIIGGCFDMPGYGVGSAYATSGWAESNKKPLPAYIKAGEKLIINDGAAYTISGYLPGYSRQSYSYDSSIKELFAYAKGGGFYSYFLSSIVIPLGEDFHP